MCNATSFGNNIPSNSNKAKYTIKKATCHQPKNDKINSQHFKSIWIIQKCKNNSNAQRKYELMKKMVESKQGANQIKQFFCKQWQNSSDDDNDDDDDGGDNNNNNSNDNCMYKNNLEIDAVTFFEDLCIDAPFSGVPQNLDVSNSKQKKLMHLKKKNKKFEN